MSKKPNIVFFCAEDRREEFLAPFVAGLAVNTDCDVTWEGAPNLEAISHHLEKADLLWFDQINARLVEASQAFPMPRPKIACRISGTEFFGVGLDDCRWEFFDHLIANDEHTLQILVKRFDRLSSHCAGHIIPAAVDPGPDRTEGKTLTRTIGYVGRISHGLNSQLLLQVMAALRRRGLDYKLVIAGQFDNLSTQIYFEHMMAALNLRDLVRFEQPSSDWQSWWQDKSHALATATHPGQEAMIFRGMAAGARPLIHNFFGAEAIYGSDYLYNSVNQLCDLLSDKGRKDWRPKEYRCHVVESYDIRKHWPQFLNICEQPEPESLPRVSIVLPTYNRASLLSEALTDLGKQDYVNLEIVVSDDCSTDDTPAVVADLQKKQSNVKYVRTDRNLGPCHNTANAARNATGDYVLVCSDDDMLEHDAVRKLVALAIRKKADLVYSDLDVRSGDGRQTTVWKFRNHYGNYGLLRDLILSGCNRIPEVFLCRREIFDHLYVETYGRRFLNTYFLPLLRQVRMAHLPEPLYRYTVHQRSTFNSIKGLYDRVKSTQNYINAALFMYSPIGIFQTDNHRSPAEQIAFAYRDAAAILAKLGLSFVEGRFYTGVQYTRDDGLYKAYLYTGYHWLKQARKYGLSDGQYFQLKNALLAAGDPLDFDAVSTINVPEIYRRLPWFAFRPFNTASSFVALDICTLGAPDWLADSEYEIYRDERMSISVANHVARTPEEFAQIMSCNPITVVNVFDQRFLEPVARHLIQNHLFSVQLLNFSDLQLCALEMLRNVYNLTNQRCKCIDEYLTLLTETTAVRDESTLVPTGA